MEKAEISKLISSFNAIKGYFDTTKKYMPQIAKLVVFIEEVVPLLQTIHTSLHQSTELIPSASEKLGKVTSATELATTEVMDIVDRVISRLNSISSHLDSIDVAADSGDTAAIHAKTLESRDEINGSQDDLFSIMNALQFQDITTQQINSIGSMIESVQMKLSELLKGFDEDGIQVSAVKIQSFDPNAEFDFDRSAESQKMVDEVMNATKKAAEMDSGAARDTSPSSEVDLGDVVVLDENGQPDVNLIIDRLKAKSNEE